MAHQLIINGELYHYGKKGMKWGKRKVPKVVGSGLLVKAAERNVKKTVVKTSNKAPEIAVNVIESESNKIINSPSMQNIKVTDVLSSDKKKKQKATVLIAAKTTVTLASVYKTLEKVKNTVVKFFKNLSKKIYYKKTTYGTAVKK